VDIYSLGVIFLELLNSLNTEMERVKTLQQVRNDTFLPQFLKLYECKTEVSKLNKNDLYTKNISLFLFLERHGMPNVIARSKKTPNCI